MPRHHLAQCLMLIMLPNATSCCYHHMPPAVTICGACLQDRKELYAAVRMEQAKDNIKYDVADMTGRNDTEVCVLTQLHSLRHIAKVMG